MTAHKHAKMIKAKAENMDLVVFGRYESKSTQWEVVSYQHLIGHENYDHFLCLPQHKDACLHWLNGGEVEFLECGRYHTISNKIKWSSGHLFMGEMFQIRIKPKKEKRHIYISTLGATTYAKRTKEEAAREVDIMGGSFDAWKHYEIEIEVEV